MKNIKALPTHAFGRVCDTVAVAVEPRMNTNRAEIQATANDDAGNGDKAVIWFDWYYLYFRYVHFCKDAGLLFYQP